jgi:carboxyl-terminal processing protease
MRSLVRILFTFALAIGAMGTAYAAGYLTAARVREIAGTSGPVGKFAAVLRSGDDAIAPGTGAGGVQPSSAATSGTNPDSTTGAGDQASPSGATGADAAADRAAAFETFWEALDVIRSGAYKPVADEKTLTYGAIAGSLRSLDDPYTVFSDPVDTAVQQPDLAGEFEGIGAYVTTDEEGRLVIQTPMRGQPAEKAGVKAGDVVIKVDGKDITGLGVNEAVLLIRGPKGTTVTLTILRESEPAPIDIAVVRDKIDIPSVDNVRTLGDLGAPEVGYLQLSVFGEETRAELVRAIDELRRAGARALIVDVRNNPGGYLQTAIGVASEFIADKTIVYQEDSSGQRVAMTAESGGHALDLPLVLLVNRGSASASEILAGAIHDNQRGVLVGETTFGKGSVQNVHKLSDNSELRVTIAAWLTPSGGLIHKKGIAPDVLVKPDEGRVTPTPTPRGARSPVTDVRPQPTGTAPPTGGATPTAAAPDDVQLRRAVSEAVRLLEGS